MTIQIRSADEIGKLLSFVRVSSKGNFEISPELVATCFGLVQNFARENNISVHVIDPSGTRIACFSAGGAIVSATLGYAIAAIPGAIIGAVGGAVAGYMAAHVTIKMHPPQTQGGPVTLSIT